MEREGVTRKSWQESGEERRAGGNIEKNIDREGEKGKREIDREGEERERECVHVWGVRYREEIKKRHKYKYRYYIVLYNQPRSILTL